jgi:ribosomal protein S18 acetylase RimI-like enzyme
LSVRRLAPDEWRTFREVRLTALKDAPYAFGSSWEKEKDASDEQWRAAVTARSRFVAVQGERVVGMAAGGDSNSSDTAALTSLWVEPGSRGQGIGDQLVTTVVEWAKAAGFSQVSLWVTEGNVNAEALYRRNGFMRTGETVEEPLREFEMARRLVEL